jgi:hypothetical protein
MNQPNERNAVPICQYHLRFERAIARIEAKVDAIAADIRSLQSEERELRQKNGQRAVQIARLDAKVAAIAGVIAVVGTAAVNFLLRLL